MVKIISLTNYRAVAEYSGNQPYMMFVDKLPANIETMNLRFAEITQIFMINHIENFAKLPKEEESIKNLQSASSAFITA